MNTGTLYGIGVGPGDPELIPLKAIRCLAQVDVVFSAASTKNDYSLAVDIAMPYIPEGTTVEKLDFPMSRDRQVMQTAWRDNAGCIARVLEEGRTAAFLTLGDPLTYSTYGYILRYLQSDWPHLQIRTIPGITSYQAAAAAINRPLVEGEESLLVMSGVHGGERLRHVLPKPDNVVFLKAYRNVEGICRALKEVGMLEESIAVSNCSQKSQQIHDDVTQLSCKPPNYWTLIMARQKDDDASQKS